MAAKHLINSSKTLYSINKKEVFDTSMDTIGIRDRKGMKSAVLDWYITGEADYCLSTSMDMSTYSKTAMTRGNCVMLMYDEGKDCQIPSANLDKEWLFYMKRGMHNKRYPWMKMPEVGPDAVWSTVIKSNDTVESQCLDLIPQRERANLVMNYWIHPHTHLRNGNLDLVDWVDTSTYDYTHYIGTAYGNRG